MLQVGIHDDVVVSKAEINDKGTLEIEFKQPGADDALDALSGNGEIKPDQTINIRVYKQEVEYFGEKREGHKMLSLITNFKAVLTELLRVYIDNPVIDASKGLKVTKDNASELFTDQANVDIAYNNIVTQFVAMIKPFVGKTDQAFRVKLPRRSKKYAYPALPNFTPWVEPMTIPKESSKLKWSAWEITNGKNDPTPASDAPSDESVNEQLSELDNVFGDA